MSGAQDSMLARKIKSASFDVSVHPCLEDLEKSLGAFVAAAVSKTVRAPVETEKSSVARRTSEELVTNADAQAACYLFSNPEGAVCGLMSFSAAVTPAVSECLLGGVFQLRDEAAPTSLDVELSRTLVDLILPGLVCYLQSASETPVSLHCPRHGKAGEGVLAGIDEADYFTITFDLTIGENAAPGAVAVHFSAPFLDRLGLLDRRPLDDSIDQESTRWHLTMRENVENTEISLPIILYRYRTTLSELSRLEVGQVIALEEGAHEAMDIMLETNKGPLNIGKGRLGTYKKQKAIKVVEGLGAAVPDARSPAQGRAA